MKKKILVFTGAGVSAESGVKTFRDSKDGLWNEFKIEEVASLDGWKKDRKKVLEFYNIRRREMKTVVPNKAHQIISDLENHFDVTIVSQNVDNLHERAGSTNIIHLHGELSKVRSTFDDSIILDWDGDLNVGDKCPKGSQLRPSICWFGEALDASNLVASKRAAEEADVCIVVGTSMSVSPANAIPFLTKETALIYYVDPSEVDFHISDYRKAFFYHIQDKASIGMEKVYTDLMDIFINKK